MALSAGMPIISNRSSRLVARHGRRGTSGDRHRDMHTDVNSKEIKQRLAQSAYRPDPREVAAAIIVKLALNEESAGGEQRGDPIPSLGWEHPARPAV
jgi:hypothetical protein